MAQHRSPRPFDDAKPQLRTALADGSQLLVCLDFDGTLAPIVDDPEAAAPTAENETAVRSLASAARVTTAIVSGRALADVRDRIDGPTIYAGNHGLELERAGSIAVHPIARKRSARLTTVCSLLSETVGTVPNCHIENKRLTGTVHLRSVPSSGRPLVRQRTTEIVDRFGEGKLDVSTGKRILEIGPAIPWGKGNAVELIAAALPRGTVPIYVGDDITDESAFQAIEPKGVGIRVGGDDPSAASVRVESPADVAPLLSWLASTEVDLLQKH